MKLRRLFASNLIIAILISLLFTFKSYAADTVFDAGDGSANNPYIISTAAQFDNIRNGLDKHYMLSSDIDFSTVYGYIRMIGTDTSPFTGSIDGNGHKIVNLKTLSYPSGAYQLGGSNCNFGLFPYTQNAVFKNLGVVTDENGITDTSGTISGYAGILIGSGTAQIDNCFVSGSLTKLNCNFGTGLIAGWLGPNSSVTNCSAVGSIRGHYADFYRASIMCGGLVGTSRADITNCYARVDINGSAGSSGLGAFAYTGGLVGAQYGGSIFNCYASGNLTATASSLMMTGDIAALTEDSPRISGCYYNTDKAFSPAISISNARGLNDLQMKTAESYNGWDFERLWIVTSDMNDGYPCFASNAASEVLSKLTDDQYAIFVVDSKGNSIANADITFDGITKSTDIQGSAIFDKFTLGQPLITVSCDGYHSYSNANINYEKNEKGYETIVLYDNNESIYKLGSAVYVNEYTGSSADILVGTKRLSTSNESLCFSINCTALVTSTVAKYELWQNNSLIKSTVNGMFENLTISQFPIGKDYEVRVYGTSGGYVATHINLEIVEDKAVKSGSLKISDEISFDVGPDVPFFGGSTFSLDIPDLPVEIYQSEDTIHVGVNVNLSDPGGALTPDSQIEEIKGVLDELKKMNKVDKNYIEKLKNYVKSLNKSNVGEKQMDIIFMGYGEAKVSSGDVTSVSLNLYVVADASYEKNWQINAFVVPLTVGVKVGLETKGSFVGSYDYTTSTVAGDLAVNLRPYAELHGGIGVGKVLSAQGYGKGEFDIQVGIVGMNEQGVNYVDFTGEAGFKAYIAWLEFEKPFYYRTWHLWTRTTGPTPAVVSDSSSGYSSNQAALSASQPDNLGIGANSGMFDISNYTVADTSYLSQESEWLGNSGGNRESPRLVKNDNLPDISSDVAYQSAAPLVSDSAEINNLLENTYRNSSPVMAASRDDLVMAFVRADNTRNEYNRTTIQYSVYNKENGTWSAPIQVDSNRTADCNPSLYSDGTSIWLAYQESNTELGNDTVPTAEDFARSQDITVAKFDSATDTFVDVTSLAGIEDNYDFMPTISIINGIPTVIWISNSNLNVFGANNTNTVMCSQYIGESWQTPFKVVSGLNTVTDLKAGNLNGEQAIAFVVDGDSDLSTFQDRALWIWKADKSLMKLDEGYISDATFTVLPGGTGQSLVWNDGVSLSISQDGVSKSALIDDTSAIKGNFSIVGNRIIFASATGDSSNLFAMIYDSANGSWSKPIQITEQNSYLTAVSPVEFEGETYTALVKTDTEITAENVEDSCTLSWMKLGHINDIAIEYASYNQAEVIEGEELAVSVGLVNKGDGEIRGVDVDITDSNGLIVASQTENISLKPSESGEITVLLPLASQLRLSDYSINVHATDNDTDTSGNTYSLTVGYSDLEVKDELLQIGGEKVLLVTVANKSHSPTAGTLYVYGPENEAPVSCIAVPELTYGDAQYFRIELDSRIMNGKTQGVVTVKAVPDVEEVFESNSKAEQYVDLSGIDVLTYAINSISDRTLTELTAGYDSGTQETGIITIIKNGSGDLNNLAITLSGTNDTSFAITQPSATTLDSTTTSTAFTVKAIDGLTAGTYTATLTVSADHMSPASFTVTQIVNESSTPTPGAIGIVNNPDGSTATSGSITVYKMGLDENYYYETTKTIKNDGSFSTGYLSDGRYRIRTDAPFDSDITYSKWVEFKVKDGVPLTLDGGPLPNIILSINALQIRGSLENSNGNALTSSSIRINISPENPAAVFDPGIACVLKDGIFKIGSLPAGNYNLSAYPDDSVEMTPSRIAKFTVDAQGHASPSAIALQLGVWQITGSVVGPDNTSAITSGSISVTDASGKEYCNVLIMSDGTYKIGGLEDGQYYLVASPSNTNPLYALLVNSAKVPVTISGNSVQHMLLTLRNKPAETLPPKGRLDTPAAGQSISGVCAVKGWFLDGSGVAKVEVLVDGTVVGKATYGQARTDVVAVYPDYKNNNSGFSYSLDTTKLTNGGHSIVIRETGVNGAQTSLTARSVTVSNALPAKGALDTPKAGQTISGICAVKGWFLDGNGISKIEVLVDGTVKGTAVYGQSRADVGALFPAYKNNNSGYSYNLDTTKLTNGSHSIVIRETGGNGTQTGLSARTITVSNVLLAKGALDTPKAGQTVSGVCGVKGWFLDGSGVAKIEVLVDGAVKGTAAYGQARTDVGAVFPDYKNSSSGYSYNLDTTKLTNGSHSIVIRETGVNGAQMSLAARSVTVANALSAKGALDTPKAGQAVSGVYAVKGWFLDGSGVAKIEILVDGAVKGTAAYGQARTDVGGLFPAYGNNNCGFVYNLDTTKLTKGSHSIVIRETGVNSKQTSLSARTITVSN